MAEDDSVDWIEEATEEAKPKLTLPEVSEGKDVDALSFLEDMDMVQEGADIDLSKPWMKHHKFELILSKDRVKEVVDQALETGRVALDLETEGFDNRVDYDAQGVPTTRHKIVGYCLGIEGAGYYIPVRHRWDPLYDGNPNVDDVEATEKEITKMCLASQPVVTEEGLKVDPLSSRDWVEAPKVIIEFWHAKFDQEFLYPITGIDWWHPDSFEDGMLANYVLYTDDDHGLKENAFRKIDPIKDGKEEYRYEMIKFSELFIKGMKKRDMAFYNLRPEKDGNGWNSVLYGCSDGICTNLLCKVLVPQAKGKGFGAMYRVEKQVAQAVRILERYRVLINKNEISSLLVEAEQELKHYEDMLRKHAKASGFNDFNPGSTSQLAEFLFSEKGLNLEPKPEKTANEQYKTDEKTLERLAELNPQAEVLGMVIKFRQIDKIRGTYLQNLVNNTDENNQLRLNFKQTGAATGRFTAPKGDPGHGFGGVPIQGIPARDDPKKPKVAHSLRRTFIARPGYKIVKVDYASQELRIAANVSGERKWIAEYEKEIQTGEPADLHYLTAAAFFPGLKKGDSDFKLKRGMGKCVHPASIVDTDVGYLCLQDLFLFPETEGEFLEVPQDDAGSCGPRVDGNLVKATYNGGVQPLVHVVSRKGVLTCTENHRFMLANGELVRAGDLKKGMELTPVAAPPLTGMTGGDLKLQLWKGVPAATYNLSEDLCYFAGAFLGDGAVNASSSRLHHGSVDKLDDFGRPYEEWQDSLYESCTRLGLEPTKEEKSLYLGSRVLVKYFMGLGLVVERSGTTNGRMKNLRVPPWVTKQGPQGFLSFLAGLIDTDGSVAHQRKTIEFTTKDFVFAGQLAVLGQACGLTLSVEATFNKTYKRHYARLKFTVESSWRFRDRLRYAGKLERLGPPVAQSMMPDTNAVLKVIPAGEGQCYDITMGTKEHLYRANGLLTHNTANFALVYGGGVGAVQRATGCDPVEGARLKKAFDDSVPSFSKWVKKQHESVKKNLGVKTAFGRFIAIPDAAITDKDIKARVHKQAKSKGLEPPHLNSKQLWQQAKKERAACERKSTNFPIQGCIRSTSLVQTRKGQQPIGFLVEQNEPFEVWVGDQWASAVAKDMGSCELADVLLKDGTLIECDTRHKLLIVTDNGYEWIEYPNLEPGMAVATSLCEPLKFDEVPPLPEFETRDRSVARPQLAPSKVEDLWYWLGRYTGDGWLEPRGGIVFCFGDHEQEAIKACCIFWREMGLNPTIATSTHTPKNVESIRHRVEVWSVDLYDWLLKLGLQEGKTAHTKRLPERLFYETLDNRKTFLRGFMDSDGHKPDLPKKVNGLWESNKKGSPYNLHLCQKPLLVDTKRLLRTVGVESVLRGPYRSGTNSQGEPTTSYRLDIQRRMFERNVMGNNAMLPTFSDMYAPEFLVDEFLDQGPYPRKAFEGNESAYNLYLRLKGGGQVTVYTLKFLCRLLGVELESPIYGFKRLESKVSLGREEHTYTLSVDHPLHRYESDGVITKNSGADILKISLVMLSKELTLRGWLRNGDDSVRMIMTVHDEIVFEVKEERLAEAIPIILKVMEYPTFIAKPKWKVPLIAEAEIGDSWSAKLDWLKMLQGDPDHPVPDYLRGKDIDRDPELLCVTGERVVSAVASEAVKKTTTTLPTEDPPPPPKEEKPPPKPAQAAPQAAATTPTPSIPSEPHSKSTKYKNYALFTIGRVFITDETIASVYSAVKASVADAAKLDKLHEVMPIEFQDEVGQVLYPAKKMFLGYPDELERRLREVNLSTPEKFEILPMVNRA